DPCAVSTGGVTLHAGSPPDGADTLNCSGADLACSGEARVAKAACDDGFAITIESGNATLVVRLQSTDSWKAGARLNGIDYTGSLTMSGLYDPSQPAPPVGQKQRGAFALHAAETV